MSFKTTFTGVQICKIIQSSELFDSLDTNDMTFVIVVAFKRQKKKKSMNGFKVIPISK